MQAQHLTENELRTLGLAALEERLGPLGAERFVVMMARDGRDYTEWHEGQPDFPGEISELAARIRGFAAARACPGETGSGAAPKTV